jgi:hypothetical protein
MLNYFISVFFLIVDSLGGMDISLSIILVLPFWGRSVINFYIIYSIEFISPMRRNDNDSDSQFLETILDQKNVLIALVIGLVIGAGLSSIIMNSGMSKTINRLKGDVSDLEDEVQTKTVQIEDLEDDKEELESALQKQNSLVPALQELVDDLNEALNASKKEVEDLKDYNRDLEMTLVQQNSQIASLSEQVEELNASLSEYEGQINIKLLETGTEWNEAGDYDLESVLTVGYSDDFLVIYEIENIYHSLIYQIAIDVYIVSGSTTYHSHQRSSSGSIPEEGDWYQSYYNTFDISGLSDGYYNVIVTATDLITGKSDSKTYNFQITLD